MFTGKGTAVPYIIKDSKLALERHGCEVQEFLVTRNKDDSRNAIRSFKPDFIFTIDHFGIDETILEDEKTHCFSWFVDNPFYFINETNGSKYIIMAVTDKSYINELRMFGFDPVFYLPLATNVKKMQRSIRRKGALENRPEIDISFVGTLGKQASLWKNERQNKLDSLQGDVLEFLIRSKIRQPKLTFDELFEICESRLEKKVFKDLSMNQRGALEFRIDMETSAYFREKYVLSLNGYNVHVFGDESWKKVMPEKYYYGGLIDYEKDLGALYKKAKVNLNVTRTQIQTGINQRVLDIAASGSVFLTDYRITTQDFFECDISKLMYHNEEDLKEKAYYLIENKEMRETFGGDLYASVCKKHTYDERMNELLNIVKEII